MPTITMADAERAAKKFAGGMQSSLGDALKMIALYGSVVRGDFSAETSDVNLLVLTKKLSIETMKGIAPFSQRGRDELRISCLFLEEEELSRFVETFPVRSYDIKKFHKVVAGENLLENISIEWRFFKEKVREEALNVKLKLRRTLILGHPNRYTLVRTLQTFLPHILSILRALVDAPESQKFDCDDIFLAELIKRKVTIEAAGYEEIVAFYEYLFAGFDIILDAVEKH